MTGDSSKDETYQRIRDLLAPLIAGIDDTVAVMASTAALLHEHLEQASWTGFYRAVSPDLLRIGPYQGGVGCLEIPVGEGVCGAAARDRKTYVVPDVHAFPGHIACDSEARSEIVVPVLASDGSLAAVLDVDSRRPAAFDESDRRGLEAVAELLQKYF